MTSTPKKQSRFRGLLKKHKDDGEGLFDFDGWNQYLTDENDERLREMVHRVIEEDNEQQQALTLKSTTKPSKGKQSKKKTSKNSGAKRSHKKEPPPYKSKFLQKDEDGRLPLHLALACPNTPQELLIKMMAHQPRMTKIATGNGAGNSISSISNFGGGGVFDESNNSTTTSNNNNNMHNPNGKRLPLHLAVEHGHHLDVVKETMSHYETALRETDGAGKTPLDRAMEVATTQSLTRTDEKPRSYCWGVADGTRKWQKQQRNTWAIVEWLLEELAKQASNPFAKPLALVVPRNDGSEVEDESNSMLLEALTHAAPPSVVSLLVEASAEQLSSHTKFAWSALTLCIAGHYPLYTLQSIAKVSPDKLGSAKDETGMGLVASQFAVGCFEQPPTMASMFAGEGLHDDGVFNRRTPWALREDRVFAMERCLKSKSTRGCWDDELLDWWDKVKYLAIFCGQCPEEEDSALCDALSNPDTPPLVVELLLALDEQPTARSWEKIMPITLAASTRTYIQKHYEINQIRARSTIEVILDIGIERAAYCRYNNRLPLHYAIDCGKSWIEMKPLVSGKRRTVRARDPVTKLYPFQLAATRVQLNEEDIEWITLKVKNQRPASDWNQLLIEEQEASVKEASKVESLSRLRTVYELLRRSPTTLVTATRKTKPSKQLRDSTGMGMVGAHFTLWCFKDINRIFVPNYAKIDALLEIIEAGSFETGSSEIKEWWDKAKFWIWYCFVGENGTKPKPGTIVMPRDDEYLLHAALSNSDTPPQVIHLLLNLYPEASSLPLPGTGVVPLHLASSEESYLPRRHECESFPEATTMDLVLNSNPRLVSRLSKGRLPLHLALESGKNWNEIEGLVVAAEQTLAMRDPVTGFFAFQLSAMRKSLKPEQRRQFQWAARNNVSEKDWKNASTLRRNKLIRAEQAAYQRNVLTTVYQLILGRPDLLQSFDPSVGEPEVLVVKKRRSTVIHFNPLHQGEGANEELSEITKRLDLMHEDEALRYAEIPAAVAPAIQSEDRVDDEDAFDESSEKALSTASIGHLELDEEVETQGDEDECVQPTKKQDHNEKALQFKSPKQRVKSRNVETPVFDKEEEKREVEEVEEQGEYLVDGVATVNELKTTSTEEEEEETSISYRQIIALLPEMEVRDETNPRAEKGGKHFEAEEIHDLTEDLALMGGVTEISESYLQENEGIQMEEPERNAEGIVTTGARNDPQPNRCERARNAELGNGGIGKAAPSSTQKVTSMRTITIPGSEVQQDLGNKEKGPFHRQLKTAPESAALRPNPKEIQSPPTFGYYDSSKVKQVWHKSGEEERVYRLRSGWTANRRNRRQVDNFTAHGVDKNLPCLTCNEGKREALILPCRHLCVCRHCSVKASLKSCPLCDNPVKSTTVIHL